jgi:disulfide bond formation protein DsbB
MGARLHPLILLGACAVALGAALVAQFGFGLAPCHLCTLQRIPYAFAALLSLIALLDPAPARQRALLLGLCAASFATNIALAFYHVGVERHWWEASCSGGEPLATTTAGLLARLKSGPPAVACDAMPFALFGVSIAGMNLIASVALAGFGVWATRQAWRMP